MQIEAAEKTDPLLRMRDLERHSGLTRQTIHFYLSEGLLPPPRKRSRNMAWYGEEHLDRLQTIQSLQRGHFLPLKAIKSVLGLSSDPDFTPEQRRQIAAIRALYALDRKKQSKEREYKEIGLSDIAGLEPGDAQALERLGLIALQRTGGEARVSGEDAGLLRQWAALREMGFTSAHGFSVADLETMSRLVDLLFDHEAQLFSSRLSHLPPEEALGRVLAAVGPINALLGMLHERRIRRFLSENETLAAPAAAQGEVS